MTQDNAIRFKDNKININQGELFPQLHFINNYVSDDSKIRIISEIVDNMSLDDLINQYSKNGAPAYNPLSMLKIIITGYSLGIQSSRKLASLLEYDLRFMYLAKGLRPNFRTIAMFRKKNGKAIDRAFHETVRISIELGIVAMNHISIDGTKIEANVSRKEIFSMKNIDMMMERIEKRTSEFLKEANKTDEEEDKLYGDLRGDEIPENLRNPEERRKRLEKAKEKIEKAKEEMERTGRQTLCATDPESRIMKTKSGKRAAYNAQAAVDKKHQVIVAADVSQAENDSGELVPMIEQTISNTGMMPKTVTADSGYHSQENLQYAKDKGLNAYIPEKRNKIEFKYDEEKDEYICPAGKVLKYRCNNRNKHNKLYRVYRCKECAGCVLARACQGLGRKKNKKPRNHRDLSILADTDKTLREEMQKKILSAEGKLVYALRKIIVEPVFGDIKFNMNLVKFLLRGLEGARIEFLLGCIAHNMKKIMAFWTGLRKKMAIA
jgi:transposase